MTKNLSLLKKIGILSVLCFCLVFVAVSSDMQSAAARPCCSSCEVYPGDDEVTYCENLCAADTVTCYNNCINRIHNCWRVCSFSC